jgi:hypothetical protein
MRSVVWTIALATSVAVGIRAQEPRPTAPGQPPAVQGEGTPRTQDSPTAQLGKTTISGCIQTSPPAAPAPGATASAATASKFDLAGAKLVTPAPVGTTGTSTVTRYRLEGDEKTLSPHLNHQVEIVGTVSAATAAGAAAAPMLKVESVKMISATCPQAGR